MTATAERTPKTKAPKAPKAPKPARQPRPPKAVKPKAAPARRGKNASKPEAAPKEVSWPSPVKPSLMLLPPKVAGRRAHKRAVKRAWLLSLAILAATGVAYVPVAATAAAARQSLTTAEEQSALHRDYLAANAPTQDYYDGLIERRQAVADGLLKDVSYSQVIKAVNAANHVGAVFTQIGVKPAKGKQASMNPFTQSAAVGYVDISGTAPSVSAVGDLVASISASKDLLTDAYLSSSAVTKAGTEFKLTVGYTSKALSFKGEKFRPKADELATAASDQAAAAADAANQTDTKDSSQ